MGRTHIKASWKGAGGKGSFGKLKKQGKGNANEMTEGTWKIKDKHEGGHWLPGIRPAGRSLRVA